MAGASKRTQSSLRKTDKTFYEEPEFRSKRFKTDSASSADSSLLSNYCHFDRQASSDSEEYEDHSYSIDQSKFKSISKYNCNNSEVTKSMQSLCGSNRSRPRNSRNRSKCESKNAVMARLNRQKKKKYIEDLKARNEKLESENILLKEMLDKRLEETSILKRDVLNLHNVIRNSTEIGTLLKCIHQNTDLKVTSSLLKSEFNDSQSEVSSSKVRVIKKRPFTFESTRMPQELGLANNEEGNEKDLVCLNSKLKSNKLSELLNIPGFSVPTSPEELLSDEVYYRYESPELEKPDQLPIELGLSSQCNESDTFVDPMLTSTSETNFDPEELFRCETPTTGFVTNVFDESFLFGDLSMGVGVCLHVADKKVSLEFCEACNRKASY